jgi:hypothetical protein
MGLLCSRVTDAVSEVEKHSVREREREAESVLSRMLSVQGRKFFKGADRHVRSFPDNSTIQDATTKSSIKQVVYDYNP